MRIISGSLKGRQLQLPKGSAARPTSDRAREALFNILQPSLVGSRVLDLFAGSGALGVEALSRGAACCVFVELDRANARALRESLARFAVPQQRGMVVNGDFRHAAPQLAREGKQFDLIFLDPPYEAGYYGEALELSRRLLAPQGCIVAEHERGHALPEPPAGLEVTDVRQYGKNTISFYRSRGDAL